MEHLPAPLCKLLIDMVYVVSYFASIMKGCYLYYLAVPGSVNKLMSELLICFCSEGLLSLVFSRTLAQLTNLCLNYYFVLVVPYLLLIVPSTY